MFALAHHHLGHGGLVHRELKGDLAVLEMAGRLVAGVAEHAHHAGVLGEHDRVELPHARFACRRREVLEQHRTDAASLMRVSDDEGDLGVVRPVLALVPADRDDLVAEQGNEGDPIVGGRRW